MPLRGQAIIGLGQAAQAYYCLMFAEQLNKSNVQHLAVHLHQNHPLHYNLVRLDDDESVQAGLRVRKARYDDNYVLNASYRVCEDMWSCAFGLMNEDKDGSVAF